MANNNTLSLQNLPYLVLHNICKFLTPLDDTREPIRQFSLVSIKCAVAASPYRLERVSLRLEGEWELRGDLDRLRQVYGKDRLCLIRLIRVVDMEVHYETIRHQEANCPLIFKEDWCELPAVVQDSVPFDPYPRDKEDNTDSAWLPLAELIQELPGLSDFIYSHHNQIPPCLLNALHQHHAQHSAFRLHVHTFSLRSLYLRPNELSKPINLHEYNLATSPCLYSIVACYDSYTGEFVGFNEEAISYMRNGAAPKLKHVVEFGDFRNWLDVRAEEDKWGTKPSWNGFGRGPTKFQPTFNPKRALTVVHGHEPSLQSWKGNLDFSKLRTLLVSRVDIEAVQALVKIFKTCKQSQLVSVVLSMKESESDQAEEMLDQETAKLFSFLPSTVIDITLRWFSGLRTLESIVRHQPNLDSLEIQPNPANPGTPAFRLTPWMVDIIIKSCPRLSYLEVNAEEARLAEEVAVMEEVLKQSRYLHIVRF